MRVSLGNIPSAVVAVVAPVVSKLNIFSLGYLNPDEEAAMARMKWMKEQKKKAEENDDTDTDESIVVDEDDEKQENSDSNNTVEISSYEDTETDKEIEDKD